MRPTKIIKTLYLLLILLVLPIIVSSITGNTTTSTTLTAKFDTIVFNATNTYNARGDGGLHPASEYNDTLYEGRFGILGLTNDISISGFTVSENKGAPGTLFNFSVTVNDSRAGIDSVIAYIQKPDETNRYNLTMTDSDGDSIYNATWNSTGADNGTYVVDLFVNDTTGESIEQENRLAIALSAAASGSFINTSVNFVANQTITLNVTNTSVLLDIVVRNNVSSASVSVTQFTANTQNSSTTVSDTGTTVATNAMNKFIDIIVENQTNDNLSYAFLNISYTDAEVTAASVTESTLKMYKFNDTGNNWYQLANTGVDTTNNYVWGNVTSFSSFGMFGAASSAASDSAYSGGGASIGTITGIADVMAEPTIYDLDVSKDHTLKLKPRDKINFVIKGEKHLLQVSSVLGNEFVLGGEVKKPSVKLWLYSEKKAFFIEVGETKTFDLNGDGKADLTLALENILDIVATIKIKFGEEVEKAVVEQQPKEIEEGSIQEEQLVEEKEEAIQEEQLAEKVIEKVQEEVKKKDYFVIVGIVASILVLVILLYLLIRKEPPLDVVIKHKLKKRPAKHKKHKKGAFYLVILVLIFSGVLVFTQTMDNTVTGMAVADAGAGQFTPIFFFIVIAIFGALLVHVKSNDNVGSLIYHSHGSYSIGRIQQAKAMYKRALEKYKQLPEEEQLEHYHRLKHLHSTLSKTKNDRD